MHQKIYQYPGRRRRLGARVVNKPASQRGDVLSWALIAMAALFITVAVALTVKERVMDVPATSVQTSPGRGVDGDELLASPIHRQGPPPTAAPRPDVLSMRFVRDTDAWDAYHEAVQRGEDVCLSILPRTVRGPAFWLRSC